MSDEISTTTPTEMDTTLCEDPALAQLREYVEEYFRPTRPMGDMVPWPATGQGSCNDEEYLNPLLLSEMEDAGGISQWLDEEFPTIDASFLSNLSPDSPAVSCPWCGNSYTLDLCNILPTSDVPYPFGEELEMPMTPSSSSTASSTVVSVPSAPTRPHRASKPFTERRGGGWEDGDEYMAEDDDEFREIQPRLLWERGSIDSESKRAAGDDAQGDDPFL